MTMIKSWTLRGLKWVWALHQQYTQEFQGKEPPILKEGNNKCKLFDLAAWDIFICTKWFESMAPSRKARTHQVAKWRKQWRRFIALVFLVRYALSAFPDPSRFGFGCDRAYSLVAQFSQWQINDEKPEHGQIMINPCSYSDLLKRYEGIS